LIEGGTVNVSQFRSAGAGGGIYSYTQTGGEVLVRANEGQPGATSGNSSLFSLDTEDAVFNMSGGRLTVYGNRGEAIFINSGPGNFSVTGGTVRVENRNGTNAIVSTRVPFWDFEVARDQAGDAGEVDLITSTSDGNTITDPNLVVLNDFTIEAGINFDHNGNDVTIGSDFTIEAGADYEYDPAKPNTTLFNGTDNAFISFLNRTGGVNDEQEFWNFIVDRPSGTTLGLISGKTGGNLTGDDNNLLNVQGNAFKILSGTFDQANHSIRVNADTLVNYDVLTLFDETGSGTDSNVNSDNDLLKLRPTDFVLLTADTSQFGNVRLNNSNRIVTLGSDLLINRLEYRHGRMNLGTNNLTIDVLDVNLNGGETDGGDFSVEDMFITAGNASDGGLSLKVNADATNPGTITIGGAANTTNNPTVFFFPIGTGTSGLNVSSEYTPANIRLASATDDGYITVIPVTQKLSTAGPYPLGNDISDRYWIVDYRDFTTVPVVERMWFRSVERDDPNGGAAGFPANYVPGYVLEDSPFTRTAEVNGDDNSTSFIQNNNAQDIRIFFWGNEGPATDATGNPAGGFNLIHAAYTAGDPSKFVGSPTIYYSSTAAVGNNTDFNRNDRWNQANRWSTVGHYSTVNTGTFPQEGDIAIMAFGLQNANSTVDNAQRAHWYYLNADGGAAKLIFSETVENANGDIVVNDDSFQPQLIIAADNTLDVNFGTVEGNGTFNVELDCAPCNIDPNSSTVIAANITADFGLFADVEPARFDFDLYSNNNTSVYMPTDITSVFPNLQIKGQGGNGRRLVFESDVTVNRDLVLREGGFLRLGNQADGDVVVGRNLDMTTNNDGDVVEFPLDGPGRVLTINGDINMDNNNDEITFRDNNNAGDVTINRLRVGGNINQATGQIILYSGAGPNRDQVELEVFGETDAEYTRTNNPIASLYRLIVNKGTNRNSTFTFQDNFSLNGEANGTQKALELQNGTLILNDNAIDIDLTTGGDSFVIPATASLQITQGLANANGNDSGILLDGSIVIDGGTLDMTGAGNGNNFIEYSASGNALIDVSAGSLLVGSQIRGGLGTTAGVLKYRQTGGTVEVGLNAAPEADRSVFEIRNAGSEFTYTGGDLIIRRQNTGTPTVAAIRILPTDFSISRPIIIRANDTGQGNLGINANVPLAGLTIEGVNNPTVVTNVNSLELSGDLDIQTGASFNANGIDLILDADLVNNGTFTSNDNETHFISSTNQEIRGANAVSFFDFTKTGTGTLDLLGNPILVSGLFSHEEGIINDNGNIIELKGNAVIEGEISSAAGGELLFSGASSQQLLRLTSGTTDLGVVTIANPSGIVIPEGNGYNFNINGDLRMNGGVFNIGSSSVVIGQNADITTSSSFSVSNMVRTNSSFSDNGLSKVFSPGTNGTFVFPIGEDDYTPVEIDFGAGSSGSSLGSIAVRPANEFHPTVNDGVANDFFTTGDINNVLQYYWTLRSTGLSNFTADVNFNYDQSDVAVAQGGFTEADYIAAAILAFDNPTNLINKFTETEVDETTNQILFPASLKFNGVNSNGISGDYFAGIDEAIPDNVATYTSQALIGDVNSDATYVETLPNDGTAPSGAVLVVSAGTEVTFNVDNVQLYKTIIESGATLNVDDTDGHRLGFVEGTGNLKITSNGSNANLPFADYGTFFSCSGGGLEYAGTGSYSVLANISTLRNLVLSGSGVRNFPDNNVTICEDLVVDGPVVNFNTNERIIVNGSSTLNSGTVNLAGNGVFNTLGNFAFNGGVLNGNNSRRLNILGNMILDGSTVNLGNSILEFRVFSGLIYNSGSFNASGSGDATFVFISNSGGNLENTVMGDFTGSNAFRNLSVEKGGLGESVILNGNIEITESLTLDDGKIISNGNDVILGSAATVSPARGKSNSYITGKVIKPLNAGDNFAFPIGSIDRWRPAVIFDVSAHTWEAQFFAGDVVADRAEVDDMSTSDAVIASNGTLQQGEYYVISDNATGGTASSVEISWGAETDVASGSADRGQLTVMVYNTATSDWDNLGGSFPFGLGTQNEGRVRSTSPQTFSEKIFIMGSTDAANPLPVEMVFFTAENKSNRVELNWQTASEKNNDFFEVQRSFDGKEFEVLGIVEGNGDSQEFIEYEFNDYSPLAGDSYYRLRQVDYDGAFEYSQVVRINRAQASDLVVVPNPTQSQNIRLRLSGFNAEQKVQVVVFDMQGRKHYEAVHNPSDFSDALPIDQELNSGIYIIDVKQGNIRKKVRLMIR
jgi:hypothetical protein